LDFFGIWYHPIFVSRKIWQPCCVAQCRMTQLELILTLSHATSRDMERHDAVRHSSNQDPILRSRVTTPAL
jgi:hypothetical protein